MPDSTPRLECRAPPRHPGDEPDLEVGSRAGEANRVERPRVQLIRPNLQPLRVVPPRGDRIAVVESRRRRDRVPQTVEIGLTEHLCRPTGVRRRRDRPVDVSSGDVLEVCGSDVARICAPDERRIEVGQELGIGIPASAISAGFSSGQRRIQSSK